MRDLYSIYLERDRMSKAKLKAEEDPRVQELTVKIANLRQQRDELINEIAKDIYKELKGS